MNVLSDIKAFLFDIDGTLINKECLMTSKMLKTLKYLKENDYIIGINSGRPVFSSRKVMNLNNAEELFDYYYGSNGVEFFNRFTNKTTYVTSLSSELIKEYAKIFDEDFISLGLYYNESEMLLNHYCGNKEKLDAWGIARFVKPVIYDFNNFEGTSPKLIFLFDKKNIDKVDKKIKSIKDDRVDIFYSGNECGEIVAKGTNKGVAVDEFSNLLNINPKQIMCFGDAENDIPALIKGTGVMMDYPEMANKYNIELSCKDVNNDGIYNFLKVYLPID